MKQSRIRLVLSLIFLLVGGTAITSTLGNEPTSANHPAAKKEGRVVVLGFDGADARTVGELVQKFPGRYPTFEKLQNEGTFAPLNVVASPESPVSWASLNTGMNPAKTGVPGFIRRELPEGGNPAPGFGYIVKDEVQLENLENTPIPAWSAGSLGAACGVLGFVLVFGLAMLAMRKIVPALVLGLVVGGIASMGGSKMRGYLPESYPHTGNVLMVDNFWDYLARNGEPTVVLDAAQAFDRPAADGAKVLSGLGVPDARGELGNWFVFTTNPDEFKREGRSTNTAGTVFRVDDYDGIIETKIEGPPNFWKKDQLKAEIKAIDEQLADPGLDWQKAPELTNRQMELKAQQKELGNTSVPMKIELGEGQAKVTLGAQSQTVKVGEWSEEFFELSFEINKLISVDAVTRVKLVKLDPYMELFVNVLDIDPRNPPFWQPISSPHSFAAELADECGRIYETYGWPTPTMPFKDKEVAPEILLEDVEFTMKWREDVTHAMLKKNDWTCLMSVFSTTDRIQHMMYQFYDQEHPLYDPAEANRKVSFFGEEVALGEAIPMIYQQMDRVMGDVLSTLAPEDTMLVCSDHGFQSFRRQVHINNWLADNGYLKVKPGVSKKSSKALQFVDWDETQVYSLGLGFLYVNLKGRETRGIVDPADKRALMEDVRKKLMAATDPETGAKLCNDVYIIEDHHSGEYIDLEADMITGLAPPHRVGWSTSSGGLYMVKNENTGLDELGPICSDNTSPWSGGHVSMALPDVAGVFFSNKRVQMPEDGVQALHIAPTVLDLLDVPVPDEMDLKPLDFAGANR